MPKSGGTKPKATVIEAARALSAVCDGAATRDGQGFNGADSPFVKSVLSGRWISPKQSKALHRCLGKYKKRLASMGFKYDELRVPTAYMSSIPGSFQVGKGCAVAKAVAPAPAARVQGKPAERPALQPWEFTEADILAAFDRRWTPRPQQLVAIKEINDGFRRGKRFGALEAGTGMGKSPTAYAFANALRKNGGTHFLTIQKVLQDQYVRDWPSPDIETLKGRANYKCSLREGCSCADAPCTQARRGILPECVEDGSDSDVRRQAVMLQLSPEKHYCPYWKQLQMCRDSGVSLFNFSSFLYQQRLARFPKRRLLIIDEAHNIESQLMSYVTVELTEWALSIINVEIDKEITSKEQFSEWLREKEVMGKIGRALEEGDGEDPESTFEAEIDEAQAEALRDLQGKLENFIAFLDKTEWILETVSYEKRGQMTKKVVARPLYAKGFAEDLLFRHAERVLVMSATFLDMDVWCDSLGISRDEVEHVEIGCDFPVKNRPIFLSYAGNCARKYLEETKPKLVQMVKAILNKHEGQRGIIHSHSFDLQDLMRRGVASDRFLFQQDFPDKAAMLEEHARKEGSVIVAPAMSEGLDLKDDLGRFQILLKVPWPSLGDKVVKERAARDGRWYGWLTALKATQSFGRIVRGCDDWGHTYIVDSGWEWFVKQHGHMIPDWVRAAFRKGVLS